MIQRYKETQYFEFGDLSTQQILLFVKCINFVFCGFVYL